MVKRHQRKVALGVAVLSRRAITAAHDILNGGISLNYASQLVEKGLGPILTSNLIEICSTAPLNCAYPLNVQVSNRIPRHGDIETHG